MDEFTDPTGEILNLSLIEAVDAAGGVEGAALRVVFGRTQLLGYWAAHTQIRLMAWMCFPTPVDRYLEWRPSESAIMEWWQASLTPHFRRKYESDICALFGTWIDRLTNPIHRYG